MPEGRDGHDGQGAAKMTASAPGSPEAARPFEYLPVGFFASVMGLTGLGIAWRLAHLRFGAPQWVSLLISAIAIVALVLIGCAYMVKLIFSPDIVKAEFNHPIAGNLFGTILISLLLVPILIAPFSLMIGRCMWMIGAVGMIVFAWLVIDRWMSDRQQTVHATPAWMVPVVGLLDVPLALPALQLQEQFHGVMVLGLAVGLFFAVPLFTLIMTRLLFEPPMPDSLQPTLMILLAPFAVGTSTYVATTGTVDLFAQALYALTLFMLSVLLGRLRYVAKCCPFRVGWWAVSFPLAAASIAALRIAAASPNDLSDATAIAMLGGTTLLIAWMLGRTVIGIARGELRALSA